MYQILIGIVTLFFILIAGIAAYFDKIELADQIQIMLLALIYQAVNYRS